MRSRVLLAWSLYALLLTLPAGASDKKTAAPLQVSNLHFTVVKDDNNKPVRNASVVIHPLLKNGSQAFGGFQIKTDNEGHAGTEGIPYGPLRIQVLAPGMQTFGEDYQISQPEMSIEIRLKRPSDQFSAYDTPKKAPAATTPPATTPAAPPKQP